MDARQAPRLPATAVRRDPPRLVAPRQPRPPAAAGSQQRSRRRPASGLARSRIEWKKKMLKFIFQKMLINISMKMLVKRFGKNIELNIFFKQILVQLFPKMFNFL
jgi:hypothetical protein